MLQLQNLNLKHWGQRLDQWHIPWKKISPRKVWIITVHKVTFWTCVKTLTHLKVRDMASGLPITVNSSRSEKEPHMWLMKETLTVWQAPGGTTPSWGLMKKQPPNLVAGFDSLTVKVASISPLFDSCTWNKEKDRLIPYISYIHDLKFLLGCISLFHPRFSCLYVQCWEHLIYLWQHFSIVLFSEDFNIEHNSHHSIALYVQRYSKKCNWLLWFHFSHLITVVTTNEYISHVHHIVV